MCVLKDLGDIKFEKVECYMSRINSKKVCHERFDIKVHVFKFTREKGGGG